VAFGGRDFLRVAVILSANGSDEAMGRSAISRAYYASFHVARDYCDRTGFSVSRGVQAHVELRQRFGHTGRIGQDLSRLHLMRKQADYDVPHPTQDIANAVRTALALANRIIADVDALP
jgi:uncharacterized protein (UPF0332 family)